ncbi:MAG: TolC family outer membrane protein [Gammaproteobacteria bacterium]
MFRYLFLISSLAAVAAPSAHATDLWQVWQLAQANDPAFRQAVADRNASMQAKPEAWANLFPSIALNASRTWNNDTDSSTSLSPYSPTPLSYSQASNNLQNQWGAQLTQTLFNWQQFAAVKGAGFTVAQAEATYESTLQGLIVSVAQAYFNVLNARDVLNADLANQKSLGKQYQQTQQQYKVGLIAVTGVRQAEAGYDQARAQVIADRQALAQTEEALRAITGQYITNLEAPRSALPLHPPQPENVNVWVTQGLKQNPSLIAAQYNSKVAENQVAQQQGGYMPNLNLVLESTRLTSGGSSSVCQGTTCNPASPANSHSADNQIGLQLSWNIFSGGATRAAVKQFQYQADSAMAQEIAQRRSIEQQVRNAYLAVLSGIAQVQATKQSVAASQIALQATEAGLQVGTQTVLDVLTSRSTLLTAQKSYFIARYNYLVAVLQLEQAAGTLTPADLKQLNDWLRPANAPGTGSTAAPSSVPAAMTAPDAAGAAD